MTSYLATHIRRRTTYVLELSRKGSRRIIASAMPADRPGPDRIVPLRNVPLEIRQNARRLLKGGDNG